MIIDEFGFDKIERAEYPEAAHLLYKIIASRNQKRSTALVTNVDFDKWGDYLSDGPLAMAFLDRLDPSFLKRGAPIRPVTSAVGHLVLTHKGMRRLLTHKGIRRLLTHKGIHRPVLPGFIP